MMTIRDSIAGLGLIGCCAGAWFLLAILEAMTYGGLQ
jgi:hypothetical protein